jgi:methionine-rich copper-binding protein CopC
LKIRILAALVVAPTLLAGTGGEVSAHANLVHCSIKNGQIFHLGHVPAQITATFAEDLDPNQTRSWMAVFEGQADHGLVTERQISRVLFQHPDQMILNLPKLIVERYYLIWHTHSEIDGHYAAGIVYFRVVK